MNNIKFMTCISSIFECLAISTVNEKEFGRITNKKNVCSLFIFIANGDI